MSRINTLKSTLTILKHLKCGEDIAHSRRRSSRSQSYTHQLSTGSNKHKYCMLHGGYMARLKPGLR